MQRIYKIVLILSLLLNVAIIGTFGYLWASEKRNTKSQKSTIAEELDQQFWSVAVLLDMPDLKPPALQYAFFDYDPIPEFLERVKAYGIHHDAMLERARDEREKEDFRKTAIRRTWDGMFNDIPGTDVGLLMGGSSRSSNGPPNMLWFVTKIRFIDQDPLCWCIPVKPEMAKKITIVLNNKNSFNITEIFDDMIAEGQEQGEPQYPADQNFKNEPKAYRIFNTMIRTIENARTLYYESVYWFGVEGTEGREKTTYRIWLKKPHYGKMEASVHNRITGTCVVDGEFQRIFWGQKDLTFEGERYDKFNNMTYIQNTVQKGHYMSSRIAQELQAHMATLIFDPNIFYSGYDHWNDIMDGVKSHGTEVFIGETCDIIEVSYLDNERSKYFWISQNDHLPRKLIEIVRMDVNLIVKEVWSNVFVNMGIPGAMFSWTPPEGWTQYFYPELEENLLDKGTPAPDFELMSIDGNKIRLADYIGNAVLLHFWEHIHSHTMEQLSLLQRLQDEYRSEGLIVIGINTADDPDAAAKALRENGIKFINIVDPSIAAQDLRSHIYTKPTTRSANPMTYIIDKDGNIFDAWYGFEEEGEDSPENRLKPFGFE
jgi:peroxiredoxin